MDNDTWMKKKLVQIYKKIKFNLEYTGKYVESMNDGNRIIGQNLSSKKPFMCVRLGAVEARCIDKWMNNKPFTAENMDQIHYAAGVYPQDESTVKRFCEIYTNALQNTDVLGIWSVIGEKKIMEAYCPSSKLIPLRSIEPYYHKNPWSAELEGKRVLIVHPFVESIKNQYDRREKLFENKSVLPVFKELILLKAIQSNAGGQSEYKTWFDAFDYMKAEIDKIDFDIAIIGAGAYGLPLAAHVKSLGKQAIQMAGSTQILFGIKGRRWDNHPFISKIYNEYWIRPSKSETPPKTEKVEGGSYW